MRVSLKDIQTIQNNGGMTLKNGEAITYKTGFQVADYGVEAHTPEQAFEEIQKMNGNCGLWLENGTYYIDHSFRVKTKKEALEIGRKHNQISVLKWEDMSLVYC